ncbi:MAG: DUF3880 domain-containing protein [Lachnospiraceae bacterium]|nr:DUF3880 domain-containing protein [Lachnospiraceae bacterium]
MTIILCSWDNLMEPGIISGFSKLGISVTEFKHPLNDYDTDADYLNALSAFLLAQTNVNAVFSVNYIPVVAMVCKAHRIPYLSWTVDCPCLTLYSDTIAYPTNYIFLFDRVQAVKFAPYNPGHIFHLPLAFDPSFFDEHKPTEKERTKHSCDVSFIGSLYIKNNQYDSVSSKLPSHMQGYVDGLLSAQQQVYGYNLLKDSISDEWADSFLRYAEFQILPNYRPDYTDFIADYYLGYKCTQLDRIHILRQVSQLAKTHTYTTDDTFCYPEINNLGIADSTTVTPKVFASSRINLNISLRMFIV